MCPEMCLKKTNLWPFRVAAFLFFYELLPATPKKGAKKKVVEENERVFNSKFFFHHHSTPGVHSPAYVGLVYRFFMTKALWRVNGEQ